MRVDCYNASECPISEVACGDTFYLEGRLWIKVEQCAVDLYPMRTDRCSIVALDRGELRSIKADALVILADTKIVANTKEIANEV